MDVDIVKMGDIHEVKEELSKIGVTPEGIEIMAPKFIFKIVKLKNIKNVAANILKQEMLSLGGEAAVHKQTINCKIEKTDVLLGGTLKIYFKLIQKLKAQVLGLAKIGEVIERQLKN